MGLRVLSVLAGLLVGVVIGTPAHAGNLRIKSYVIFGGGNTDSTEQSSAWFPVFGAKRIYVRTWSAHAAWATDNADSTFSDSITTFKVLLSDSLAGNTIGPGGRNAPIGGDSIVVDAAVTVVDTAKTFVKFSNNPINKELRGASNGSGLISLIAPPVKVTTGATPTYEDAGGFIPKQYMRIKATPLRRNTVSGNVSTEGKRVNGLKGFRMVVHVVYEND